MWESVTWGKNHEIMKIFLIVSFPRLVPELLSLFKWCYPKKPLCLLNQKSICVIKIKFYLSNPIVNVKICFLVGLYNLLVLMMSAHNPERFFQETYCLTASTNHKINWGLDTVCVVYCNIYIEQFLIWYNCTFHFSTCISTFPFDQYTFSD